MVAGAAAMASSAYDLMQAPAEWVYTYDYAVEAVEAAEGVLEAGGADIGGDYGGDFVPETEPIAMPETLMGEFQEARDLDRAVGQAGGVGMSTAAQAKAIVQGAENLTDVVEAGAYMASSTGNRQAIRSTLFGLEAQREEELPDFLEESDSFLTENQSES